MSNMGDYVHPLNRTAFMWMARSTSAGVKEAWKQAWQVMVRELAPQDTSGAYVRQSYAFESRPSVWPRPVA